MQYLQVGLYNNLSSESISHRIFTKTVDNFDIFVKKCKYYVAFSYEKVRNNRNKWATGSPTTVK